MTWEAQRKNGQIYDYVASFALTNGQSDYDLKATQATAFSNIKFARGVVIKCDQDITVKFNNTSFPSITIRSYQSPFELFDKIDMTNIYLSNASGVTANIEVMLV